MCSESSLPPKFGLSDDLMNLTISDVCKECEDGTSDLMNIQCNASNIHGYSFAQGYVNVLRKLNIHLLIGIHSLVGIWS